MFEAYEVEMKSDINECHAEATLIDTYPSVQEAIKDITSIGWEEDSSKLIRSVIQIRALNGVIWATGMYVQDSENNEYPLLCWVDLTGQVQTYQRIENQDSYKSELAWRI
jgi:hypothetical protein